MLYAIRSQNNSQAFFNLTILLTYQVSTNILLFSARGLVTGRDRNPLTILRRVSSRIDDIVDLEQGRGAQGGTTFVGRRDHFIELGLSLRRIGNRFQLLAKAELNRTLEVHGTEFANPRQIKVPPQQFRLSWTAVG